MRITRKPTSRYNSLGLADGQVPHDLEYHPPTSSVILHTRNREGRLPSFRLSIRSASEERYSPVGEFAAGTSVHSFALSRTAPILYYNTVRWGEHDGLVGGEWDALYRFTLDSRRCDVVARRGELIPPNHFQSAWPVELFSVSDDGAILYCTCALGLSEGFQYYVSKVALNTLRVEPITRLEATFL